MSTKKGRVFVRGITSPKYGLSEVRRTQHEAPRVRSGDVVVDDAKVGHSGDSEDSKTWWRLGPGDDPFLTQNIQVHFVELPPGKSNHGHGHQNEACFYVLEGRGYEIHDDKRYDWEKDDLVVVHNDSVHRHFNASGTERALTIVMKAKSSYMFLGLIQQGRSAPVEDEERWGPRRDWTQLWSPSAQGRKKIVKLSDTSWETTRDGHIRLICSKERDDVRVFSIDLYEQDIPADSHSAKHWHMADEVLYVIAGSGYSLHWEVEAEIAERYYARIAKEPSRHDFEAGDIVYIPQNSVHQHFNASSDEPLRLLSAQNRLIKLLGYDNVVYLEDAPEYEREPAVAVRS
jgi:quercetin dioxygenase-like cupin family protein